VQGQVLELGESIFGVRGALVAVEALLSSADGTTSGDQLGIALVRGPGRLTPVSGPSDAQYEGLRADEAVLSRRRLVALVHGPNAFVAGGRRTKPAPISGQLEIDAYDDLDTIAATPGRVVFVASRADGKVELHELRQNGSRLIAPLPVLPTLLAAGGDDVAFTATFEDGDQLWVVRDGAPRPLVRAGDPTPLGAIDSFQSLGFVGNDVVFTAALAGDGARHGLLAVSRR
jgi:hypothetical protein